MKEMIKVKILIIDGMGGGIGKAIIELLKPLAPQTEIIAVGTNSIATSAMLKAGADCGATGENAVIYNSANCDIIAGVIGIAFANSMHGEISPKMAEAVSSSKAHKMLIPIEKCNVTLAGVSERNIGYYIRELCEQIKNRIDNQSNIM